MKRMFLALATALAVLVVVPAGAPAADNGNAPDPSFFSGGDGPTQAGSTATTSRRATGSAGDPDP